MSDSGALATAAARIVELTRELAAARQAAEAAERARDAALAELAAAKATGTPDPRLQARVTELEALLADPPTDSGVTIVQFLDPSGAVLKRRYRASDGSKHRLLPDAMRQETKLALMGMGLADAAADAVVANGDTVMKRLRALKS